MINTRIGERTLLSLAIRLRPIPFSSLQDMCLVMGYILDLTVVLSGLFQSAVDVSPDGVQSVIRDLVESGHKTIIHREICSFVKAAPKPTYQGHDLILERVIDLIRQFCILSSSNGDK
jgi:hypothetical protein